MSLTFIAKSFLVLILAALSGWAGQQYALPLASYLTEAREVTARDARISRRVIVYRIPEDRSVAFAFSQPVTTAKVLIHPAVPEEARARDRGFVYGLRASWSNADGEVISQHEIYLQAEPPDAVFVSGDARRFFRTAPELVAEQDQLLIESPQPAMRLELAVFDVDEEIIGVDVRVFEQRAYIGNQSLAAFRRLRRDSRELLTRAHAFPLEMLTEREQALLGRSQWRPVGPLGLDQRDYTMLMLYEALSEDGVAGGDGLGRSSQETGS